MSWDYIHIHRDRLRRGYNIFLLFIPVLIFAVLVAFLFAKFHTQGEVAGINTTLP